MYLDRKEILGLKKEVQNDIESANGEDKILLLYVLDILDKLSVMLKKGSYRKDRIVTALHNQDWMDYSFASKSLYSDKLLRERLQIRKNKKIMVSEMLRIQADYLSKASYYIITRLD